MDSRVFIYLPNFARRPVLKQRSSIQSYVIVTLLALMTATVACSSGSGNGDAGRELTVVEIGTLWVEELQSLPAGPVGRQLGLENLYQEYTTLQYCPTGPRIGKPRDVENVWAIECGDEAWNLDTNTLEFIQRLE